MPSVPKLHHYVPQFYLERFVNDKGFVENEGDVEVGVKPYQIPYRVLLPKKSEAENLLVVMDHDPVMHHGHIGRLGQFAILEFRRLEEDVVYVPLSGLPHRVYQRRIGAIDRGRLAVRIGLVLVTVQNLDLVPAEEEDTAVPAPLAPRRPVAAARRPACEPGAAAS